jgi:hypothetical protein
MHPYGLEISSPRRPKKNIIDKICPNISDIKVAQKILVSIIGPEGEFKEFNHNLGLKSIVNWLQVNSCILRRRN